MSQSYFQRYVPKKKNSVIKEEIRQAKKKAKKERAEAINRHYEEKRQQQAAKATEKPTKGKKQTNERPLTIQKGPAVNNKIKQTAAPAKAVMMPLNKYLAHCGVTSRRDAVPLIQEGKVKVNGKVIKEPGCKVAETDEIIFNGKKLFITKNLVYILLNKPKDYITTTDDPQGRKTVLQLVKNATQERIYPIGRLDRNTSGVLLLTNDGELTQKLSHPSYQISKIYEVKLDKPLNKGDFDKIMHGMVLEDGAVQVDSLAYADARDKSVIGIEIHSGKNRIVRRIFEHFGYDVKGLDRVMYANLTKKNVERGKWRYLSEKEVRLLKFLNASRVKGKGGKV